MDWSFRHWQESCVGRKFESLISMDPLNSTCKPAICSEVGKVACSSSSSRFCGCSFAGDPTCGPLAGQKVARYRALPKPKECTGQRIRGWLAISITFEAKLDSAAGGQFGFCLACSAVEKSPSHSTRTVCIQLLSVTYFRCRRGMPRQYPDSQIRLDRPRRCPTLCTALLWASLLYQGYDMLAYGPCDRGPALSLRNQLASECWIGAALTNA
jgi:hypothetical protein